MTSLGPMKLLTFLKSRAMAWPVSKDLNRLDEIAEGIQALGDPLSLFHTETRSSALQDQIIALQEQLIDEARFTDEWALVLALLHLWLDDFEHAHVLVQDLDTVESRYVHSILHRRQAEFDNAAYWMRRVRHHVTHQVLRGQYDDYDPFDFIDYCEMQKLKLECPKSIDWLRGVQELEIKLLYQNSRQSLPI